MKNRHTRRGHTHVVFPSFFIEKALKGYSLGFTLIEILVAVLIIGILAAIAVPQYQRAVLKSRFAALMPIAKSMADSNEAFYLEHGEYADNAEDLPIQGRRNYSDGTELEFGTMTGYSYVLATRDNNFPNNYIVYQKHSEQYPGEIHCEAAEGNNMAQDVCKSFGPTQELGETLTPNYLTYVLFGTGNGVAPTGDNGGDEPEEPEEPQTPTCEGAAPTKQEACSSGCGSVTVTAACEEGEWVYPTANMSSCPVKPNDETVACDTGFTGNKTRTATCNSAGTAWEFTDNWNTSGCTAVSTCSGSQPPNITASQSGATGTASCVNGQWVYAWSGGKTYGNTQSSCTGNSAYACAGSTFSGDQTSCQADAVGGCEGSIFSGSNTGCFVGGNYGQGIDGCANSTFSGTNSMCVTYVNGGCEGSTFTGSSWCWGINVQGACSGAIIKSGAQCRASDAGACDGALYGKTTSSGAWGYCKNAAGGGNSNCPTGVPTSSSGTAWKGNCCNPAYMAEGTSCPSNIAICGS